MKSFFTIKTINNHIVTHPPHTQAARLMGRAMIAAALTPLKILLKAVAGTTRNQTARLGMCKKLALGYAGGKPNPLNPPCQGDFPLNNPLCQGDFPLNNPLCQGDFPLHSPLTRGARGVRNDKYWVFAQSLSQVKTKRRIGGSCTASFTGITGHGKTPSSILSATLSRFLAATLFALLFIAQPTNAQMPVADPDIIPSVTTLIATEAVAITPITITNNGGAVPATGAYSINPLIANGLRFNTDTGEISGTPANPASAQTYIITAANDGGTDIASVIITVNAVPIIVANPSTLIATVGTAITPTTIMSTGGPVTSYFIALFGDQSLNAATGLDFDPSTGSISGTPTMTTGALTYGIFATNAPSVAGTSVVITILAAPAPDISPSVTALIATQAVAITPITIDATAGGAVDSYSISPDLPAGLSINPSSGEISGTPMAVAGEETYMITATNAAGSHSASVTITVNAVPIIAADPHTLIATVGTAITPTSITNTGGPVTSYAISLADSQTLKANTGLDFDPSTGSISGTPTMTADGRFYTISATNAPSFAHTASIDITIVAAPDISPSVPTLTATVGTAIPPITITNNGGAVARASYSISPNLPAGLSINPSIGSISGTPTAVAGAQTYTITANGVGIPTVTATATVDITVNAADNTAPDAPVITQPTTPTNDASITISGSAEADATVTLSQNSNALETTATAGSNGDWSIEVTLSADNDGANTFTATATDQAGNASGSSNEVTVTLDQTKPAIAIRNTSLTSPTNDNPIPINLLFSEPLTGFEASDITVHGGTITADSYQVLSAVADGRTVNVTFTITPSADGPVQAGVAADVATDAAGNDNANAGFILITYDGTAPDVAITSTAQTVNTATFTLTGTTEAGATVDVLKAGTSTIGTASVTGTDWTFATTLTEGTNLFTVTASDAAGNVSEVSAAVSITLDSTAVDAPSISISPDAVTATAGTAIADISITSSGGDVVSYTIAPAIGNGLSFDETSGTISGTPTAEASLITYTITAENSVGSGTATIAITVNAAPTTPVAVPIISISRATLVATVGSAITPITISSSGGDVVSYSIDPAIANGLSFEITTDGGDGQATHNYDPDGVGGPAGARAVVVRDGGIYEEGTNGALIGIVGEDVFEADNPNYTLSKRTGDDAPDNATSGIILGTPTAVAGPTSYTITATNSGGTAMATVAITVNDVAPIISISRATLVATVGSAITPITISSSGGGNVVSYSIDPAIANGLSFEITTDGGDGQATHNYDPDGDGGPAGARAVVVRDGGIYEEGANGALIGRIGEAVFEAANADYTLSKRTGDDAPDNATSGIILGTPTAVAGPTSYTITATNSGGTAMATVAITVNDVAPIISISRATLVATVGSAITPITISSSGGGNVVSYSIDPAIANGLSFNATSGIISGTPTAVAPSRTYTITATNSGGMAMATVAITVNDVAPSIRISRATLVATRGSAITPITISSSGGGDVVSYSIDPAIANGLSFDATSGTISGTPTATAPSRTYTITASNSAGTDTAMVTITVNAAPVVNNPAPTIVDVLVNIDLAVNAQPHTLNVANKFSDPDDTLTFSVQSDNTATASVDVLGNVVTITPIAIGTTTITVTAADTIGQTVTQTFMVTVISSPLPNPTVCMRHPAVQQGIIAAVSGKSACGDITAADLAAITALVHTGGFHSGFGQAPPKGSDFAGLTALTTLGIIDNKAAGGLTTLPADLFQGLPALRSLSLNNNQLRTLPIGIFSGLSLEHLTLTGNPWVSLPTNILNEMAFVQNAVRTAITNVGGTNAALPVANGDIPAQSLALTANPLTLEVATFFSDTDDTLTYTATSATPAIASVAISSSTLTITPVALGPTNIMVTARDTAGQPVTQAFALTVSGDAAAVTAPNISISPSTLIATVGTAIDTITITNIGGDVVSHIITDSNGQEVTNLAGLVVDAEAGIITGTLNADADIGTAVYTITVINSGGSDSATVTISVIKEALEIDEIITNTQETPTISIQDGVDVFSFDLDENIRHVANITITGVGANSTPTYSLSDHDSGVYDITQGGVLSFKSDYIPNYEMPRDESGDRTDINNQVYKTVVMVSDETEMDKIEIRVTIQDVNEAPTITSSNTFTVAENSTNGVIVGDITSQDPDIEAPFNSLTYSITSGNSNDAFAISNTGTITVNGDGKIDFETTPSYTLIVEVADGGSPALTGTATITVNVNDVNEAPTTVGTIADITNLVANGNPQTVDVASNFNDPNDTLTFSATSNNPNIASVSGSTTITITPVAVGTTTITVTATDTANQTVTQTFVVSVSNPIATNPAPTTVGTIADITNLVANGNPQTVDVASNFNDTDALTFSATSNNPNIASVSGSTTITITPLAVGTTTITVTATDTANQTVTQTFVVSVSNPIATNPAPTTVGTIADITNLVANGNPQTVDVASNFNDTDALTFSATSNNPNIASVSGSTTITITPVAAGSATITVTATDTANQTVTQTFVVSVSNPIATNPAPTTVGTIADITNLVANGNSQTVDVASNFNDTDALTFSATSNNPNIASVSGSTTITITPLAVGTTTITVTATDTANQTVTQTFVVSVSNPIATNPAPTTVGTIADITNLVANGNPQTVDVASNFNDTDALTFSATSNNPNIASVSGSTTITITPVAAGSATITVTATDTANQTVTQTFVVSVSNPIATNPAPTTVGTIADITNLVANGNSQTVDVASNFNDTDALTFSATSNNPNIASVSGSTTITITPLAVGTTTITVTATDTANQTVTQTFVVSVSNPAVVPNPAPTTVGTIADITNLVANGNPQTVDVASNFNDTDALTFSATSNNPSIASVSGSTTITITPLAVGSATITITATDSAGQTVTQTFVVSVSNPIATNPAPTTVGTITDITNLVANGSPQTVDVAGKFNDTDALTFSAMSNNPNIASVSGSTTITITPLAVGTTTITVTATDTANQTVTQTFVVSVSNAIATNPAPTTVGTITDITNLVANGSPQTVDVAGKFNDTDALTFSAMSNNPNIASVSGSTTITITPLAVGSATITITARDSAGQTVTQTFVVSVSNPAVVPNLAPTTVGTIADITNLVANGNPQTVDVASNFNDLNDTLTFSATSNNPNIASVSGSTTITITPLAVGTTTITVTATDTANQTVTQTFVVSVSNPIATNPAPTTVGTIADITNLVANGNPQTVDVASNFNDSNDTLTFSATSNNPSIASVSGSTTITITPLAVGTTTITVTATDTANQTVTQTFVVSVNAVPITTPTAKATESVTVSEKTIEVGGSSITVESRTIQVEVTTGVGEATTITRFSAAEVLKEVLETIANKAIATGGIDFTKAPPSIDSTITPTLVVNTAVDISVNEGACPAKGCEVTLSYEASDEQAGKDLYVFHYDGAQWEALPHVRRDTINRKVTALATSFSPLALFNASRADKLAKQLNKDILPNLVQTMLASTMSAVSTRMDAAFSGRPQAASYQFDGQTVQLDSRTPLSVNLHNTVEQKLPTYIKALKDDTLDWKRLIGNSSFVMPLNALDEDGGAGATVWGSGEYINLSDKDWKGDVFNVQLGVDQRMQNDLLAGGLVSWSKGDVDYTLDGERGKYTHRVTSIHPYMARSRDGVNLWGSVGYGQGELSIAKKAKQGTNTKRSSGTRLLSLSTGISGRLTQYGQSGLNLKSDLSLARTNIDGSTDIPADKLSSQRLRLLLEIDKERPLASGGRFNPVVEVGFRYDGGTGESGIGAVLGLGGRYANVTGLIVEGKFHTLVGRKDYKEWGIQGVIRQQSGANEQGLTFSLSPSYGATNNNANQVWEQELTDGNNRNDDYRARLDVNMGYGLFTSGGLLTPYSELRMGDSNRYRLGLRWKPNSPFNLHLYGEHTTSNDSDRILLESHIRF